MAIVSTRLDVEPLELEESFSGHLSDPVVVSDRVLPTDSLKKETQQGH